MTHNLKQNGALSARPVSTHAMSLSLLCSCDVFRGRVTSLVCCDAQRLGANVTAARVISLVVVFGVAAVLGGGSVGGVSGGCGVGVGGGGQCM